MTSTVTKSGVKSSRPARRTKSLSPSNCVCILPVFDSIPAVFSVSLDPYVVFFSNIFAILGLRAMFFLLAAIADRFRYLKLGVCVLLVFIGVKMLIHEFVEIDAISSLVFIVGVLVVSIGASLVVKKPAGCE